MTRPRGFVPYRPHAKTRQLINEVKEVLTEYHEHLPLTCRQIFYRLVALHGFEKSERGYQRLIETLVMARRGFLIPMDVIRDDKFRKSEPHNFVSKDSFEETVSQAIESFRLDRQSGQDKRLVLWCEAAGMVPQLERVAFEFGVPVYTSGGYDSVTAKHSVAHDFAHGESAIEVLHVGDYDPSGVHMFGSLDEDVQAFIYHYGGDVEFSRLRRNSRTDRMAEPSNRAAQANRQSLV